MRLQKTIKQQQKRKNQQQKISKEKTISIAPPPKRKKIKIKIKKDSKPKNVKKPFHVISIENETKTTRRNTNK